MSNPTTPFGWQMPTSTDLVTDLPADFEVFGQAVATSMADLLGGTTGQVLSKTTNADMDFTWVSASPGDITGVTAGTGISGGGTSGDVTVTNSMATAIDAKGDLIVGTGADAFSRLAVGTNNYTLVADSAETTGLKWAAPSSGALVKINTYTFSGSSGQSMNDIFSATYRNYLILATFDSTSAQTGIRARLRVSGSDNTSNNYRSMGLGMNSNMSTTTITGDGSGTISYWDFNYLENTSFDATQHFQLFNPYATAYTTYTNGLTRYRGSDTASAFQGGSSTVTTSYTGLTVYPATGTMTGKIEVYGYAI